MSRFSLPRFDFTRCVVYSSSLFLYLLRVFILIVPKWSKIWKIAVFYALVLMKQWSAWCPKSYSYWNKGGIKSFRLVCSYCNGHTIITLKSILHIKQNCLSLICRIYPDSQIILVCFTAAVKSIDVRFIFFASWFECWMHELLPGTYRYLKYEYTWN